MSDEKNKNQASGTDTGFGYTSRRTFLSRLGSVSLLATTAPIGKAIPPAGAEPPSSPPQASIPQTSVPITLRINGNEHHLQVDPRTTLLDCLRDNLQLTGTKPGCSHRH